MIIYYKWIEGLELVQKIFGLVRKAINQFNLISESRKIAVGVSGGKDSFVLLKSLCMLREFLRIDIEIFAICLDLNFKECKINKAELEKLIVKNL